MGNSFEVVKGMRFVPFTSQTVLQLAVALLLPVAPLLLTMVSMEELVTRLLRAVFQPRGSVDAPAGFGRADRPALRVFLLAQSVCARTTMDTRFRPMLLACAVIALLAAGCSRDPVPGTPEATAEGARLMRQMSDTLAKANAFRFSTDESLEQVGKPTERGVLRFSRIVTVRRPNAMYFEIHAAADAPAAVTAHYEGTTLSVSNRVTREWAQTTVPRTLDEMFDDVARRYALPVPIADVIYSVPYDAFVGRDTKGGFAGRETIDGVACARLAYTDDLVDVTVWLPTSGQPLPRRVELVYKRALGAPKARIDFANWDLAPTIAEDAFKFVSGDATTEVAFEEMSAGLLSGRAIATSAPKASGASGDATSR